jgi:stage V sporulation protein R
MLTPYDTRLPPHLQALKDEIEGYARGYGLDFFETIFEVIDADDLNEVAAYGGFPTRYPHWSFGMSYEELRKGYEYGLSKIYELVINNDPCYAYLMRSNHLVDQKLVMAHVYGHCLAPETRVETRDGVKPITDVRVGEEVLTHNGIYRRVRVCARRWFRGPIHRVRIAGSNETVRITGEHPVYALRPAECVLAGRESVLCRPTCQLQRKCSAPRPYTRYQLEWTPAADIREGDVVVFPRRKPAGNGTEFLDIPCDKVLHRRRVTDSRRIAVDGKLAKLIGYFIAEGNAQERGVVGFGFHANEAEFQTETSDLARRVFGVNIGRDDYPSSKATTIRFNAVEIAAWLREQVGTHSYNKRIPSFLMETEHDELLIACLRGIFNGDGYFTNQTGRMSGTLSLTTTSETLAYQVRHVCLRWGIRSGVVRRQRKGRRPSFEVVWTGDSAHKLSHLLYERDVIPGNRSFERSWSDDNYLYQHVRSVETEDYDGMVYNFSVEEDESYTLAAGFVVHNCDFFKNNAYFAHTNRKMMDEMANHGARIRHYAEKYGEDEVEAFVDRCMSIDDLIDVHSTAIRRREDASRYDFTPESESPDDVKVTRFKSKSYMNEYINPREVLKKEEDEARKKKEQAARSFPEHPQKDVLLFLIENAPLKGWQRDVLSIVRDEAYYFAPQGQTKTINEGWACVHYNTLVHTDHGLIPAGQLVERRLPAHVSDGTANQKVYDWAKFDDRETVWIKTRRGLELEGSLTHQIMLPDGNWRRLDAVRVGDRIQASRSMNLWAQDYVSVEWKPEERLTIARVAALVGVSSETVSRHIRGVRAFQDERLEQLLVQYQSDRVTKTSMCNKRKPIRIPGNIDESFGAFLGYLIGDGHISVIKKVIGLTTGDESQADHFAALVQQLFEITPRKKWDQTKWRILFSSRNLQGLLTALGLETGFCARKKTVPQVILRSPKSVVAAFLRALYDCDGYAGKAGVILSTSSVEMSKTVQLLLLNFGILSTRRPHKDGCWHVHTTSSSAEVFLREIGFGLARKQEALRRYVEERQWFKAEDDSDEIVAIERRRADVYDISVEETHRYAAAGFINHNSYWHSTIMT